MRIPGGGVVRVVEVDNGAFCRMEHMSPIPDLSLLLPHALSCALR